MTGLVLQAAGRVSRPAASRKIASPALRLPTACLALVLAAGLHPAVSAAESVYQSRDEFLVSAFGGRAPPSRVLWLNAGMKRNIRKILGHAYSGIRVRYWDRGRRTAWILEEIGKYKPITTGIVVDDGKIERVKVLIYRESHGWEVRYPFFTDQFRDVRLTSDGHLSGDIDGISGATLSVNALTRLARLALYFHQRAVDQP